MEDNSGNQIELRSSKVRHIVGTVPSALIKWNTIIVIFILLTLLIVIFFLPYPYGKGETIFQHLTTLSIELKKRYR